MIPGETFPGDHRSFLSERHVRQDGGVVFMVYFIAKLLADAAQQRTKEQR